MPGAEVYIYATEPFFHAESRHLSSGLISYLPVVRATVGCRGTTTGLAFFLRFEQRSRNLNRRITLRIQYKGHLKADMVV